MMGASLYFYHDLDISVGPLDATDALGCGYNSLFLGMCNQAYP